MIRDNESLTEDEKYEYARIFRSTLSQYELVLLFYNGLSAHGNKNLKPRIEDFCWFNNLRDELLAKPEDYELYSARAYEK